MQRVPYTTKTGLKIGSRYEPPKAYNYSRDMETLQSALLGNRRRVGHLPMTLLCLAALAGICWVSK